jgi:hypothetical protein
MNALVRIVDVGVSKFEPGTVRIRRTKFDAIYFSVFLEENIFWFSISNRKT